MKKFIVLFILMFAFSFTGCVKHKKKGPAVEAQHFQDKNVIGNPDTWHEDGVGVATGDMDGDGDLDIVTAAPKKIKYFENVGTKKEPKFVDRGVIGNPDTWYEDGVGVSLADMDGDGDLDIVVATPKKVMIFKNNLPQHKKKRR